MALDPKAYGQLIGRYREKRGLSQGALAEAAGISRPYLSQVESGKRVPSDEVAQRLLVLSGAPMEEYIQVVRDAMTDDEAQAVSVLLQPFGELSKSMQPEQMLSLMDSMVSLDQMQAAVAALAHVESPLPAGPEGWLELGKEDRRLVQRIVNRLRAKDPEA